ncbi:hypothetical protein PRIPAC_93180, partial [Pristionchus pacificus]
FSDPGVRQRERMAAPPAKKSKESSTISMVVEEWKEGQLEQFSAVHRINGYPWRLRLYLPHVTLYRSLVLICDKSTESDLWQCRVRTSCKLEESSECRLPRGTLVSGINFTSWETQEQRIADDDFPTGCRVEVQIMTDDDGESWRRRPTLGPLEVRDGILVIGEEKKQMHVHKESLASQSTVFDNLFFGNLREKNMVEIPIGGVEYEELANQIQMVYGFDGASLTDDNVDKVLQLAGRFDFKIIEDRVMSYLLSPSSSFSIHQRLLISDQYNLAFLKDRLISWYTPSQLQKLSELEEFRHLSMATMQALFRKSCDIMTNRRIRMIPIGMNPLSRP